MFEKIFRAGMEHGARILFLLGIALFVSNVVYTLISLLPTSHSPAFREEIIRNVLPILFSGLMPVGYLLFGAVLVDRADKIIEHLSAARDST